MISDIDIVIPWVDGDDSNWKIEFKKYTPDPLLSDARLERYRDWRLLKYWFRGIEEFAPWVRKIHFITCGHLPDWLDTSHPKLNVVLHEDYIPAEYLPVFSANPIEIFINRIRGLSEKFIYFNDDVFFVSPVSPNIFFMKNKPCDMPILNAVSATGICHIKMNDIKIINDHFCKNNVLFQHPFQWFNFKYKGSLYRTIALLPWKQFTGFVDHHGPIPYLKETLDKVWAVEELELLKTACSRFRSHTDINQYIFRYWQFCDGNIHPININYFYKYHEISNENISKITSDIRKQKLKVITINDGYDLDYDLCQVKLVSAFEKILPGASSFEL